MNPVYFVHLSDTHFGPTKEYSRQGHRSLPYARRVIEMINSLPTQPDFVIHTGDVTTHPTEEAYRLAAETAPGRPGVALGAAAINAFLPMFLFISGAVNNDNLAVPLASLALLLMVRIVTRRRATYFPTRWYEWATLGLVIGLATQTKEGTLGLIPMAVGTAVVSTWQRMVAGERGSREAGEATAPPLLPRSPAPLLSFALSLILIAAPLLAVAGWWYWRNVALYGDWLGWNAFIAVLGERGHPASLAQLWGERRGFLMSFWGLFGGVNVPMWPWVYTVLNGLLALSIAGFTVYLLRLLLAEWHTWREGAGA